MARHSHFANIKRKKDVVDRKRAVIFAKLSRNIMIAARHGGSSMEFNLTLRGAVEKAKAQSMPKENIEKAIKKGAGELEGVTLEEVMYEGFGPGGVAILVQTLTDNKTRTVAELKHLFSEYGGNLGTPNSVKWMFETKGILLFEKNIPKDTLEDLAIEAGALDIQEKESEYVVITNPSEVKTITEFFEKKGYTPESKEGFIAKDLITLSPENQDLFQELFDELESFDDTTAIYTNKQ